MADGNQNRQPRKKNAYDEFKLRLIGDPVNGSRKKPTLAVSVRKNQPTIEVRTGVEGDKDYGRIMAKLDSPTFFAIPPAIDQLCLATTPNDTKFVVKNMGVKFSQGGQRDVKLDTQLILGKDRDGILFIAVTSWEKDRPIIKFSFRPSEMHDWYDGAGNKLSPAQVSVLYAQSWATIFSNLTPHVLYAEYEEPPPRDDNRQGGGGGYGNRGGGGGGGYGGGNRGGGGGGNWGGGGGGGNASSGSSSGGSDDAGDGWPM